MAWPPTESEGVENVAVPPLRFALPLMGTPLSLKITLPVGVPVPGFTAATVAVNITHWPKTDGLADALTDIVVLALSTLWMRGDDVEPA